MRKYINILFVINFHSIVNSNNIYIFSISICYIDKLTNLLKGLEDSQ